MFVGQHSKPPAVFVVWATDVTVRYAPRPPGRAPQRFGKAMSVDVLKHPRRSDAAILNLSRRRRDGRAETRELQEPDCGDIGLISTQNLASNGCREKATEVTAPRETSINRGSLCKA